MENKRETLSRALPLSVLSDCGLPVVSEETARETHPLLSLDFVTRFKPDDAWMLRHTDDMSAILASAHKNDDVLADLPMPVTDVIYTDPANPDRSYLVLEKAMPAERLYNPDARNAAQSEMDDIARAMHAEFQALTDEIPYRLRKDREARFEKLFQNKAEDFIDNRRTLLQMYRLIESDRKNIKRILHGEKDKHRVHALVKVMAGGDPQKIEEIAGKLAEDEKELYDKKLYYTRDVVNAMTSFMDYLSKNGHHFESLYVSDVKKGQFAEAFISQLDEVYVKFVMDRWDAAAYNAFHRSVYGKADIFKTEQPGAAGNKNKKNNRKEAMTDAEELDSFFNEDLRRLLKENGLTDAFTRYREAAKRFLKLSESFKYKHKADLEKPFFGPSVFELHPVARAPVPTPLMDGTLKLDDAVTLSSDDLESLRVLTLKGANALRVFALAAGEKNTALHLSFTRNAEGVFAIAKASIQNADQGGEVILTPSVYDRSIEIAKEAAVSDGPPRGGFSDDQEGWSAEYIDEKLRKFPHGIDAASRNWLVRLCREGAGILAPLCSDYGLQALRSYASKTTSRTIVPTPEELLESKRLGVEAKLLSNEKQLMLAREYGMRLEIEKLQSDRKLLEEQRAFIAERQGKENREKGVTSFPSQSKATALQNNQHSAG